MLYCTKHERFDVRFGELMDHFILQIYVTRLLNQFKGTLQQWKTWDEVDIISSHQMIKDYLWDLFQRGLKVQVRI